MPKINLKNSSLNTLVDFLKDSGTSFSTTKRTRNNDGTTSEIITITQNNDLALDVLNNYGLQLYHNTSISADMHVQNKFNYSSNQFENITRASIETDLPLYYIENENNQNKKFTNLKSINSNVIAKNYIKNIAKYQQSLRLRSLSEMRKMKNILFGNLFKKDRSNKFLDEFCYYNKIELGSTGVYEVFSSFLKKINFQEQMFSAIISDTSTVNVGFNINNSEDTTIVPVFDLMSIISTGNLELDVSDKIVLGSEEKAVSYISNNFKRFLLMNYIKERQLELLKSFKQIYDSEECAKEIVIYKVDKFIDTDTSPIQSFWMLEQDLKEYYDYQIKRDRTYRYELKCYCIIYGTETRIENIVPSKEAVSATIVSSPSYKIAILDLETINIKVSPKIPMPPYVEFLNESNSENYIKIYLDLNNSSKKDMFIQITEQDATFIRDIPVDQDGKVDFSYSVEDGKFEVFRLETKPKSYTDFENAKILDVRNKYSSTSVVFKESVMPNKKYYYMFRAVNLINIPSNPTPVYEVELIKDASKTKIMSKAMYFEKDKNYPDNTFKNLIQIKPAFEQEVFDDQSPLAQELSSFRKKINNIPLGIATDKVWGKKFKVRIKSKDTGKIIDLNVKFNLKKDNI